MKHYSHLLKVLPVLAASGALVAAMALAGAHQEEKMKNETQHPAKSPATPAIPFFARYLERLGKVETAAKARVRPKHPDRPTGLGAKDECRAAKGRVGLKHPECA